MIKFNLFFCALQKIFQERVIGLRREESSRRRAEREEHIRQIIEARKAEREGKRKKIFYVRREEERIRILREEEEARKREGICLKCSDFLWGQCFVLFENLVYAFMDLTCQTL